MIEPRIIIKKRIRGYTVLITKTKRGYVAQCEQLPEAITQGETIRETMKNMKEAIELVLEVEQSDGILRIKKSLCTKLKEIGRAHV